jgi:hypothetical protein
VMRETDSSNVNWVLRETDSLNILRFYTGTARDSRSQYFEILFLCCRGSLIF